MFSIKLKNTYKFETKLEIIFKIFKLFDIKEKKKLYYSDYTFDFVQDESEVHNFIEDGIFNKEPNRVLLNKKYVSIEANLKNNQNKLKVEINSSNARKGVRNCSHIDIYIMNEPNLEIYFDYNKKQELKEILDIYKDIIAEFYFYDISKGLDCYTDFDGRGYEKQNEHKEFSTELNFNRIVVEEDKIKKEEIKFFGSEFMNRVFNNVDVFQSLIEDESWGVSIESGSLIIDGKDKKLFLNRLRKDMNEFIDEQIKEDEISNSFNKKYAKYKK